jgi:hypothetical protein
MPNQDNSFDADFFHLDLRHLAKYVSDVEVGARQGFRVEQEGFPRVVDEFCANQPNYGERAGISPRDFARFQELLALRKELDGHLYKAKKIYEKVDESLAVTDDQLQRMVYGFAQIIEARAKAFDDPELLALYETVRNYRSAIGVKAAKTRRRNEAELEAPQNEELPAPGEQPEELPAVEAAR